MKSENTYHCHAGSAIWRNLLNIAEVVTVPMKLCSVVITARRHAHSSSEM